jgi:mannose-6-phosphate isomerase-like protein (cupin superfamily)
MVHDLAAAAFVLQPGGDGAVRPFGADFYQALERDFTGFTGCILVQRHSWETPWPSWEMHPAGDELVVLIEGDTDLVLWRDGSETVLRVDTPGRFVAIPRGVWHTARPHRPTTMLFVTPGEGTLNAPSPGG